MRSSRFFLLLIPTLVVAACSTQARTLTPPHPQVPTLVHNPEILDDPNLRQLIADLNERGITYTSVDDSQLALLWPGPGLAYRLDTGYLHVHVYESAAAAAERGQQVPGELRQSIADWVDTPHFFPCGRLLVMYFGNEANVLDALEALCGPEAT